MKTLEWPKIYILPRFLRAETETFEMHKCGWGSLENLAKGTFKVCCFHFLFRPNYSYEYV